MLSLKNNLPLRDKILRIKREIIVNEIKYSRKIISQKVFYDQQEELFSVLHKMKQKEAEIKSDTLEHWCKENPSDFECKIYDL